MDVTTARLVLHLIQPSEAARIVAGTPGESDHWHPSYPLADELDVLGPLSVRAEADPVFGLYMISDRMEGRAIGGIGFFGPPDVDGAVELGYGLVAEARGHGYATEALAALISVAFDNGVRRVVADTGIGNRASARVLEKCGFREVRRTNGLAFFRRDVED